MAENELAPLERLRSVSTLASFRIGCLALGAGLVLSGYLALYVVMTNGEAWEGFMAPLRRHTTWADGDSRCRGFVIGVISLGLALAPLEITWRRWANARRIGLAPVPCIFLLGVAFCGLTGLVGPFIPLFILSHS
jgi:hypothetical protein